MIERKKKICKNCKDEQYIFGHGLCKSCYNSRRPSIKRTDKVWKANTIGRKSEREKQRQKRYKELRYTYLKEHHICESCTCKRATEIHHKKGRIGDALYNHFLAVCHECHEWIENNPKEAKELGYSISRLK